MRGASRASYAALREQLSAEARGVVTATRVGDELFAVVRLLDDEHGLRRHELFRRVLQSLIELSKAGGEERSLLESLSNHIGAKGAKKKEQQPAFPEMAEELEETD